MGPVMISSVSRRCVKKIKTDSLTKALVVHINPSSLDWLQARFNLSSIFIDWVVNWSYNAKSGDFRFLRYDDDGRVDKIGRVYVH